MWTVTRTDLDTMITEELDESPTPAEAIACIEREADPSDLGARYKVWNDDDGTTPLSFEIDGRGVPAWSVRWAGDEHTRAGVYAASVGSRPDGSVVASFANRALNLYPYDADKLVEAEHAGWVA